MLKEHLFSLYYPQLIVIDGIQLNSCHFLNSNDITLKTIIPYRLLSKSATGVFSEYFMMACLGKCFNGECRMERHYYLIFAFRSL